MNDVSEIHDAALSLKSVADEYGLRIALCDDISSREPMVDADGTLLHQEIFGWVTKKDKWWEEKYLALTSPMVRACRYESQPFWCNADGMYGLPQNEYLEEIDFRDHFLEFAQHQSAIVLPVHLPFGQISANSIHTVDPSQEDMSDLFATHAMFFDLLIRRFVGGYVSAIRKKRCIPDNCVLSKREVECLRWAALGKTDKEIGMIISLSHATVRYHFQRAGEKLNSVNRTQTIFKAGQLGYLGANN
ncbi:MAG: LuxR C-terminal-related transcriptional regulator [Hyphomonadaceae bacterium]